VEDTRTGFLILYCDKSNKDPKPPIFLKDLTLLPFILVLFDKLEIYFTRLFVVVMSTPLFL
jgi:hypothetical protein